MVGQDTIIVEDKLRAIFDQLPSMNYIIGNELFKPVFGFGNRKQLNVFLKSKAGGEKHPYPLIWLLYPYRELHDKNYVSLKDITLILAVNTNNVMLNEERLQTTFKKILVPLYENVFTAFRRASNVTMVEKVNMVKFPQFSGDESKDTKNYTTDTWDALKTIWDIEINRACLKPIKF